MTGAGIGSLSSTIVLASLGNYVHKNRLLLAGVFLFGVSGFLGLGDIAPMGTTVVQLSVPPQLQGRVMSIWYVSAAFMFIGSFPMTIVADTLGWTAAFAGGAAIYLVIAFILGIVRPTLRRMEV